MGIMSDFYGHLTDGEMKVVNGVIRKFKLTARKSGNFVEVAGINRYSDAAVALRRTALHEDEEEFENWRG